MTGRYRQTEIGVLPDDWQVAAASSMCERVVDCKNRTPPVVEGGDFAVVRTPNVRNGRFVRDDLRYTDAQSFEKWTSRAVPRLGDVLITREAPLGEVCLVPSDTKVCLGQRMMLYRPDSSRLDSRYLVHALASRGVRSNLLRQIGGSTVGHARVDDIRDLAIPVPATKSEQEAIAGTLGDADALIESLEQLIAKKRLIKRGAMQELLRPKSHWHSHELEDVAEVIDPHPSHRAPPEVPDGIPFVGIGDLREDGEITGTRFRTVDPAVFDEHRRRYDLRDELIGLGRVASIGKVVRLQDRSEKYAVAPTLGIIRGTKVRRRYLLYALKSDATVEQFARIMSGSTRSSVGMNVLRTLLIYLPPTEVEQSQIAGVLSDIDADIDATQATLGELIKVKQGMMQQLLTGRIRLV